MVGGIGGIGGGGGGAAPKIAASSPPPVPKLSGIAGGASAPSLTVPNRMGGAAPDTQNVMPNMASVPMQSSVPSIGKLLSGPNQQMNPVSGQMKTGPQNMQAPSAQAIAPTTFKAPPDMTPQGLLDPVGGSMNPNSPLSMVKNMSQNVIQKGAEGLRNMITGQWRQSVGLSATGGAMQGAEHMRTQGILGDSIANPYLGAGAKDVPSASQLKRINQMQTEQGLPLTTMADYGVKSQKPAGGGAMSNTDPDTTQASQSQPQTATPMSSYIQSAPQFNGGPSATPEASQDLLGKNLQTMTTPPRMDTPLNKVNKQIFSPAAAANQVGIGDLVKTPEGAGFGIAQNLTDTQGVNSGKIGNAFKPPQPPDNAFGIAPETSWKGAAQGIKEQYNKLFPQSQEQAMQLAKATGSMPPAVQAGMAKTGMAGPDTSIGELAAKYETSGKGVGFISTGMGGKDPGGISYGNYQLETNKGTMQEYLSSKEGGAYAQALNQHPVNSAAFKQEWQKQAQLDPEGFNKSQFDYLVNKKNGYNEAVGVAEKMGIDVNNPAMQQALFSTVNQSGGWRHILKRANIKPGDDIKTQINKLYDGRASYFQQIKGMNPTVRRNITKNRTQDERYDALKLLEGAQ